MSAGTTSAARSSWPRCSPARSAARGSCCVAGSAWLGGAEAVTAYGLLATLGVLAVHLVPAGLGLLGRGSVLVGGCALAGGLRSIPPADPTPDAPPAQVDRRARTDLVAAGPWPSALVVLFFVAFARDQLIVPPSSVDFLSFHMPNVARWIQSGSIWQIDELRADGRLRQLPEQRRRDAACRRSCRGTTTSSPTSRCCRSTSP